MIFRSTKLHKKFLAVLLLAGPTTIVAPILSTPARAATPVASAPAEGVIRQQSTYGFDETVTRLKADIAGKGIRFFLGDERRNSATAA